MKKRLILLVLVLLFVINITAIATLSYNRWFRSWPDSSKQWDQSEQWQDLRTHMSLNPQQSQTLQELRFSFEQEVESLRQQMGIKRNALLEEARNTSPDLDRIDTLIEEISALQTEIQKKTIRNLLEDKRLLSPAQQEKYFSLFREHIRGRGWGRRVRGTGRGGPRRLR